MSFSTLPFLFILQLAFWIGLTRVARHRRQLTNGQALSIMAWLVILVLWGIATSALSICGVYTSPAFLHLLPGLWLPMIPIILSAGLYRAWPVFSEAIQRVVTGTPTHAFILIQILRIAAIGGVYKATQGLMPAMFTAVVGIPDFLFGLSALILAGTALHKRVTSRMLGLWHIAGIAVIVTTAPFIMQLGLPGGPWYIFQNLPDSRALLEFPMVLAPTLVVPFFIIINAIAAHHLLRKPL